MQTDELILEASVVAEDGPTVVHLEEATVDYECLSAESAAEFSA